MKELVSLGLPYAFLRITVALSFTIVSGLVNTYGLMASTASGIVTKINNFATLPFTAIQAAMVTMSSQNFGAGKDERVKTILRAGLLMNYSIGITAFAATQLFPYEIVWFFNTCPELIAFTVPFLRCYAIEYIVMPTNFTVHGIISGAGHTVIPMVDGLLSAVILRVPLSMLFSNIMGFPGIALGSALATLGAFFAAIFFYSKGAGTPQFSFSFIGGKK